MKVVSGIMFVISFWYKCVGKDVGSNENKKKIGRREKNLFPQRSLQGVWKIVLGDVSICLENQGQGYSDNPSKFIIINESYSVFSLLIFM